MDQARCGEAKRIVRPGASNSAGLQLRSARGHAFAAAAKFVSNAARGLGEGNGGCDLRFWITRDSLGALDAGRQLEQRRDLQAGTRANPDRALPVGAASDLHWAFGHGARHGLGLRPVTLLAGSAFDGRRLLDQAQAGGKTAASAFSAGISGLQEPGEGARAICHLKMRKSIHVLEYQKLKLNTANRITALVLALIWITAGIVAVVLGLSKRRWFFAALATVAIWYGLMWIRVVRQGRKLQWSEALLPWRRF